MSEANAPRQLTADEIRAAENGQPVVVRLTRLYWPKAVTEYEGPANLYVERYKGQTVTLTVCGPLNWAEYDPRRDFVGNALVNEDWQMEIFESPA